MAKAGAKTKPRLAKAEVKQAVLSPASKVFETTPATWQQRHIYHKCMTAYPGKAGALTEEQQQIAAEANKTEVLRALLYSSTAPFQDMLHIVTKPDWSSCTDSIYK